MSPRLPSALARFVLRRWRASRATRRALRRTRVVARSAAPNSSPATPEHSAGRLLATARGHETRPRSPLARPYGATTAGIVTLVTLIAFEAMAVATAMPVVAADLDAVREYGFAFSAFLTTLLLGVVVSGGWCDARGPAGPIRLGLVLFAGGLVVCGAADTLAVLLLGRALAGAGGGLLVVAIYVVIAAVYPGELQPKVFSWLSAGWVLPSIVGPAVAGWLAQSVTWRAVFLLVPPLVVPPALVLLPRAARIGPARPAGGAGSSAPSGSAPRRRVLAGVGVAVGVGALQWGLDRVSRPDGVVAAPALVLGLALVVGCLPPLLPAGTLRLGRGLPSVIASRGLYAAAFFGAETYIPLMLVSERGLSPTAAGLSLTAGAAGWSSGAFLQARSWVPFPRHVLMSAAGVLLAAGQAGLVLVVRPEVPAWTVIPLWCLAAFGMGIGMASVSVLTLRLSAPGEQGRNSAALQLSDALGSAFGIGLTGAAFAAFHRPGGDDGALFAGIWTATAVLALLVGLVALRARPVTERSAITRPEGADRHPDARHVDLVE